MIPALQRGQTGHGCLRTITCDRFVVAFAYMILSTLSTVTAVNIKTIASKFR